MNKKISKGPDAINTMDHAELRNKTTRYEREYGTSDMNWEDTGNEVDDPSMTGYNSGYQFDPYQFQQWASRNVLYQVKKGDTLASIARNTLNNDKAWKQLIALNKQYFAKNKVIKVNHVLIIGKQTLAEEMKRNKIASDFLVTDYGYLPEQMAREFLTIWNGADSPIQDFYNGFVVDRFTNEMRAGIAEYLRKWGYEITPVYEDRTPKFAGKKLIDTLKNQYLAYVKTAERAIKDDDAEKMLDYFRNVFPDSYAAQLVGDLVKQVKVHTGRKVTLAEAGGLVEYYKTIYPDDYANALIDVSLDKGPFMGFQEFLDLQLTDQDMEIIDEYDSENADPSIDMVRDPGAGAEYGIGGNSFGWDPITDLRSDTGFPASTYQSLGRLKRKTRRIHGLKKNK